MAAADTVWQPFGPATQPNVGRWVAVADFNGDGAMDLAMAADGTDINGANAGAVYVQLSPSDKFDGAASASLNDIDVALYGASAGDHTGFRIANAGDVDDDGLDDLLIGSAPSGGISLGAGVAYLVLGSTLVTSTEIDLATQADATFFGQFNGDSFGYRLTGLGDVNGDGYSDILIGAPFYKASGAGRGAAYLFLGPLTGDKFAGTDEDVKFEGAINGGNFGTTVTRLGDVNGDTLTDFGIGAINDGTTGSNAGAFYVYHGRSSFPTSMAATAADWRLYGRQYERCGSSAVALGDTNNDGFGDFAVGCYLSGSFKTGLVHLFRGQAGNQVESMHVRHDYVIWGLYANDTVGGQIDAGDLDNDGQIDLVVSGSKAQGTVAQSGAAWGFYGPFPLGGGRSVAQADMKFRGQAYQDNFAYGIAVGDVNNDDYADVIIGTPNSDAFSNEGGFAALYRGGEDGADLKTFYYDGDGDGFGGMTAVQACAAPPFHVALGGDCNDADGLYRPGAEEACDGIDYNCDGVAGTVPTDLDADGVPSCGPNTAPVDCDDNDPDIAPGLDELCGDLKDNNCDGGIDDGSSIDAVIYYPDVDQDGFGDENNGQASCEEPEFAAATLTIGGDCDDIDPYVNPNAVEVCGDGIDNDCANGPDDPDAVNAPTWFADVDGDSFGDPNSRISSCVQPLGYSADRLDCNDSASSVNPAATETCDFVDNDCNGMDYLGGPHSLNEAFSSFTGKRGGDQLFAAGFLKDQDFDGDDEAIFAAIGNDDGAVAGGAVYIRRGEYAGGHFDMGVVYNDGSGDWDVKIVGDRKDALFGSSVASGDINGDGVADLLVGAPGARVPDIDQGAIYVFFGPIADGSFTMSDADAIIKGEKDKNSRFGARVTVQDVTNDGIADILASAPEYTGTLNKQGKVYLILGTLSPLPAEDFAATLARSTFVGSANNERIGAPLASLGDIDDDDYNDFIVGAPSYGALRRGAAYVFYGRAGFASGAITYDARITGDADGDTFATAVSGVGDVNADGFRDMVFGTTVNRAYLVYGSATRLTNGPISGVTAIRFTAAAGLRAGATVGRLGDINQDGHADFAIGAPDYDESFTVRDVGRMYVVFGKADYTEIVPLGGSFNLDTLESFGRILPGDLDNF
ncbi:MAG: FG-GAP repeat protein, partial [Alphaproteobacteria bacterium]|nr:FG-GAP repeat protein [Alphaproteobacteria bacterium]